MAEIKYPINLELFMRIKRFLLRPIRDKKHLSEKMHLLEAAIIIGLLGGLGAVVFRQAILFFSQLLFETLLPAITITVSGLNISIILIPALGGLIVGPLIYFFAREARGHGVPEIIEAMLVRGGKIRPVVALVKIVASALTIGSGGSAGREGPIAQIGGVIGSITGSKIFKKKKQDVRICVMCGVAAGISGTFNAPLGGAIFAMEIVGGGFSAVGSPIPILIAAALGNVVTGVIFGFSPAFAAPQYSFDPKEILFFALLGLLFGLLSYLWHSGFYFIEDLFEGIGIHEAFLPVVGGLFTGLLGMFFFGHDILGSNYGTMTRAMGGSLAIYMLIILGIVKMIATASSIGSGGSGGAFAPTLYVGTMFGVAFGLIAKGFFPEAVLQPTVFGLIGMGALFAGVMRAPVTALILIPEMTDNYHLLIPLAIASALSYAVATQLRSESFYLTKIIRKGIEIPHHANPLEDILVSEVMETHVVTVHPDTKVSKVLDMMFESRHPGYPAVNNKGMYVGYVSIYDLKTIHPERRPKTAIKLIVQEDYPTLKPEDNVYHAVNMMTHHNVGRLPVVVHDEDDHPVLKGIISKTDVVRAYKKIVG